SLLPGDPGCSHGRRHTAVVVDWRAAARDLRAALETATRVPMRRRPRAAPALTGFRFCVALALSTVLARVALFDHAILRAEFLPNHDMSQGLALFATSMHALRLGGEIAWWNCESLGLGYAQYYQAFLSPLAPTPGNIVFIIWAQLVRVLDIAGVA